MVCTPPNTAVSDSRRRLNTSVGVAARRDDADVLETVGLAKLQRASVDLVQALLRVPGAVLAFVVARCAECVVAGSGSSHVGDLSAPAEVVAEVVAAEELSAGLRRIADVLPEIMLTGDGASSSVDGASDSDLAAATSSSAGEASLAASPHSALELVLVLVDDPCQRRLRHRVCRQALGCGLFELLFAVGTSRCVPNRKVHRVPAGCTLTDRLYRTCPAPSLAVQSCRECRTCHANLTSHG